MLAHNRIAFKTGTSYGYRDAWSVGFDGRITIGVWVGRPDGAPVPGLVGRTAAAPILFDAFARTGKLPAPCRSRRRARWWRAMQSSRSRCGDSGRSGNWSEPAASGRRSIQFPLMARGSTSTDRAAAQFSAMPVKVAGGVLPMTMLVNGVAVGEIDGRRQRLIEPPGPGFARLTVIDATGAADTVVIRIQ